MGRSRLTRVLARCAELLDIHPFDFGKVIESFVKHEPNLPAHLKQHYQHVDWRVMESLAWADGSPLHALMQEYDAAGAAAAAGGEGAQAPGRAKAALQQFLKKCLYLAAQRIQDLCLKLLLPSSLVQQVWRCVKVVLETCRELLTNRHLDQIIMCSVYGVCKVNQRQVTFRHIIEKYKQQQSTSAESRAKVFREVYMKADEEPQDIIKFYNVVFIPTMKEELLKVCHGAAANGASSPTMNRVVGGSPARVSSNRDVYVSQQRTPLLGMTPRTRTLYAFSDTPAQTTSEGLRQINQTLNANASGFDSAAQTLQALSGGGGAMSPPPSQPAAEPVRKRELNLTNPPEDEGGGPRRVMQRRLAEQVAAADA